MNEEKRKTDEKAYSLRCVACDKPLKLEEIEEGTHNLCLECYSTLELDR